MRTCFFTHFGLFSYSCQPMQNSFNTPQTLAATYEDSRLVRLWRNWLAVAGTAPLDKWLKHSLRELSGLYPSAKEKEQRNQLSLADQACFTLAMNNALRFQQLACALEVLYQVFSSKGDYGDMDWQDWDMHWQTRDLQGLSPAAFWFWIQLRVTGVCTKKNLAQLRDAQARGDFFQQLLADNYFAQQATGYLWAGLRPQWGTLIVARQKESGWSEQQTALFLQQQTTTPPLWLRVQSAQLPEEIVASLLAQGVNAALDEQNGIYVRGGRGINTTSDYKQGAIEIQDLASQFIAQAVAVKPGQKIWDACAGAGGKTLAIATRMNNKGVMVATDLHDYKLEELKRRVKRANVFNVRTFSWNGEEPLRLPKEVAQQQGFDWVLVDVPCSSSGTWRRNPDARWRFDETDTNELIQLQQKILQNAAPAVRKGGGALVYATCSWQLSENEEQVKWFLQAHPEFSLEFQRILGAPEVDADTMFVSVLKRQ